MEKREIQDYDEVELQITKRMRDQGHPIRVCQGGTNYTDMEQAAVQASKVYLPGCSCKICLFHISQMSTKTINEMGLKGLYMRDATFAKQG